MRMIVRLLVLVLLLGSPVQALAHSGVRLAVVLDTDMALDDIRAITLLSRMEGVELVAAITSDGACSPAEGADNLSRMLAWLGQGQVPVVAGRELAAGAPPWRAIAESLDWPVIEEGEAVPSLAQEKEGHVVLSEALAKQGQVVYLLMFNFSNLAYLIVLYSSAASRIASVHYYGSSPDDSDPSWNTTRDLGAAKEVFASGLPIRSLQFQDDQLVPFDENMLDAVCGLGGRAADLLCTLHRSGAASTLVHEGHFRCWDETVVLDLLFPELVAWRPVAGEKGLGLTFDMARGRQRYLDLLAGELSLKHGHRDPVTLRELPTRPAELRSDVAAVSDSILARHGREEWDAVVLANELHLHLGVYSILGAKMGIRARELLDAGLDELSVLSCAGAEPPLSCLTDGLQVATGATLGRGTISVAPGDARPAGIFRRGERTVELQVKRAVVEQIRADMQACIAEHGELTPAYWAAVRALGLRYWLEMDRRKIFEESWSPRNTAGYRTER